MFKSRKIMRGDLYRNEMLVCSSEKLAERTKSGKYISYRKNHSDDIQYKNVRVYHSMLGGQ